MAYIEGGGIRVDFDVVLDESVAGNGAVTTSPIEDDTSIADHVIVEPDSLSISGSCTTDAANKLANLRDLRDRKILCNYMGRNVLYGVIIEKLNTKHPVTNAKGFDFSIDFKQVPITQTKEFSYIPAVTDQEAAAQTNDLSALGITAIIEIPTDEATAIEADAEATEIINTYIEG